MNRRLWLFGVLVVLAADVSFGQSTDNRIEGEGEIAVDEGEPGDLPQGEQRNSEKPFLDTITVSAQKREQSLEDVSVAVIVLEGGDLENVHITTLEAAAAAVPAVTVSDTPGGDAIFIRGVGSGINQGFEQSVGTVIDGVHYSRGHSVHNPFLDVDRIEILKGPQTILFGKNTIGGVINVVTRRPTSRLRGSVGASSEPERDILGVTGVVSGPLSETLFARLVGRVQTTGGYLENSLLGRGEPGRDEWVGRFIGDWLPNDSVSVRLKMEHGVHDLAGGQTQITRVTPLLRDLVLAIDPRAEFDFNYRRSGPGSVGPFARELDDNHATNASATVAWQAGGHSLTSVTSFVGYGRDYALDVDVTPLDFIQQISDQSYESLASELRLTSPAGRRMDYVAGAYWARERLRNEKLTPFDFNAVPPLMAAFTTMGIPLTGQRVQRFDQSTTTWSIFAQPTFHLTETFRLRAGLRYTHDEKDADKRLFWADLGTTVVNPTLGSIYSLLGLGTPHEFLDLSRVEDDLSALATLEADLGETLIYLSFTQGFKAGGFDEDNASGSFTAAEFDAEGADALELGVKSRTADGRVQLGASIFRNAFDGLQVSTFDGVASFVVGNAAEATSQGVELDLRWAATHRLTFSGSFAYLDAGYDTYPDGPCVFGAADTEGNPLTTCDLSGRNLQFSPETSGHFSARYYDAIGDGDWSYSLGLDATTSGGYDVPGDLDPFLAQESFWKLGARCGLYAREGWEVAAYGRNLTGEKTTLWGNDVPLSNLLGNNYFQFIDEPRTFGLQLRYRF